jgi:hypothetical protein
MNSDERSPNLQGGKKMKKKELLPSASLGSLLPSCSPNAEGRPELFRGGEKMPRKILASDEDRVAIFEYMNYNACGDRNRE